MYTASATVAAWLAPPGSAVEEGRAIVEITSEKASYELEAPAAGIFHPVVELGAELQVEELIGLVLAAEESLEEALATESAHRPAAAPTAAAEPLAGDRPTPPAAGGGERTRASPLARRLAAELGVDLATVAGTGTAGRIVEADVRAATAGAAPPESSARPSVESALGGQLPWRVRERLPLAGSRKAIAERLRRSQATAVALTLTREVDAQQLGAARRELAARLGGSLPWDALFIRLFAEALAERVELNAIVVGDEIVRLGEVNVAFAVSLEGSLVAPVVRDADRRPLAEIAQAVVALTARARAGELAPDDVAGGTATITNLGGHGIDAFTPVLNPPQSAILGIGRIVERPVVEKGSLVATPTCVLSLTFDHRVTDGAPAAEVLAAIERRMTDATWLAQLGS